MLYKKLEYSRSLCVAMLYIQKCDGYKNCPESDNL